MNREGIAFPLAFGFHAVTTCYPSVLLLLKDPCLGNAVNATVLETLCKSQETQVLSSRWLANVSYEARLLGQALLRQLTSLCELTKPGKWR